jgi:hypothetical protein
VQDQEPEWIVRTPGLKSFTYDLRKRGKMTQGYWDRVEAREQLLGVCEAQGLEVRCWGMRLMGLGGGCERIV